MPIGIRVSFGNTGLLGIATSRPAFSNETYWLILITTPFLCMYFLYMRVKEYINYLNNHKNAKQIISKGKFKNLFIVGDVGDDGNCLFYSLEYLTTHDATDLRKQVCEYYKKFDTNKEYPENSLKSQIKFNLMYDNDDANGTLHSKNICTNLKWAAVMDVVALAEILKINIILLSYVSDSKGYITQEFIHKDTADTVCIKYNGRDHFQPLIPQFTANSLAKNSASPTPEKHDYLNEAPDVSPETLKLLGIKPTNNNQKSKHDYLAEAKDVSPETLRQLNRDSKKTGMFKSVKRFFGRGRKNKRTQRRKK